MKRIILLILLAIVFGGCAATAKAPLKKLTYQSSDQAQTKNLIIFLRGMGGSHKSFEKYGFIEGVQQRDLPYDMIAPNTHFGYYAARNLVERLQEDIIEPARTQGYENIWLVGVSMGGLGSVLYLKERTPDVDGIIILAPFLGYDSIIKEISSAGGLLEWQPGRYDENKDWQRMLWHWLQQYAGQIDQLPPIYLGYGQDDTYVTGQDLLAAVLPPERVVVTSGGHDLRTFQKIWDIYLGKNVLK